MILQVEETYLKHPDFRKFCKLPATANASANGCAPPERSLLAPGVLLSYDWNGASPGYPDLGSLTQDQIDQRLLEISSSEMQRFRLGFFFDANFGKKCEELDPPQEGCSGVWIKSKHVRSQLHPAATPLDDFMDKQNQCASPALVSTVDLHISIIDAAVLMPNEGEGRPWRRTQKAAHVWGS